MYQAHIQIYTVSLHFALRHSISTNICYVFVRLCVSVYIGKCCRFLIALSSDILKRMGSLMSLVSLKVFLTRVTSGSFACDCHPWLAR